MWETTIAEPGSVPQAKGGEQRSITSATPQRISRYGAGRNDPEQSREGEDDDVDVDQGASVAPDVPPSPHVEGHQQQPAERVAAREGHRPPVAGEQLRDLHRDTGDAERRRGLDQAVDDVVGVEAVGVDGEPGPGPGDRHEDAEEPREDLHRGVLRERRRQLDEGSREDEVEVELEPGGVALLLALGDSQPGRLEAERPRADHAPTD
jgi:hypothetical protein